MTQRPSAVEKIESGRATLRLDVVAGLTAATVVLPKAMAYATVAGLPVAVGLYTAFVPMVVYALLGSSRVLSVSSTATLAILTGTQLGLTSQTARPRVSVIGRKRGTNVLRPLSPEHPDDETFEGLLLVRPEGRLFFVNAQYVAEQIWALVAHYQPRVVAVDLSGVPDIEYSALEALKEGEERSRERGAVTWWLVGLNPGVLEVVRRSGLAERLGRERMLFDASVTIERYQALQVAAEEA